MTPPASVTDGAESLHQLVHRANALGFEAYTVYLPSGHGDPVPEAFRHYETPTKPAVIDASDSVVIAAADQGEVLLQLRAAQRGLWWSSGPMTGPAAAVLEPLYQSSARCIHLAHTDADRQVLRARMSPVLTLGDYLPAATRALAQQASAAGKEGLVLVDRPAGVRPDPRMARLPAEWTAVGGLPADQLDQLFERAQVYVDLTPRGGLSRLARRAALSGCCIITAAGDPARAAQTIPPEYRLTDAAGQAETNARVREVLDDYPAHLARFATHRSWIEGQEAAFANEVFTGLATIESHLRRIHQVRV